MVDTTVSDSYLTTVELATALLSKRLGLSTWTAALSADKVIALQQATAEIDALDFMGFKYLSTQARAFPRKYMLGPEYESPWGITLSIDAYGYCYESEVPDCVELACALEAHTLIKFYADSDNTDRQAMKDQGVQNYNLGGVYSETLKGSIFDKCGMYSKEAYNLISKYVDTSPLLV
jgi:hypothetical protein